jgi:hypothetical protein
MSGSITTRTSAELQDVAVNSLEELAPNRRPKNGETQP